MRVLCVIAVAMCVYVCPASARGRGRRAWVPPTSDQESDQMQRAQTTSETAQSPPTHHLPPGGVANCDLLIVGAGVSGAFAAAR
jgi:hypothetical protein